MGHVGGPRFSVGELHAASKTSSANGSHLNVWNFDNLIKKSTSLLYINRIFQTDTPLRDLCTYYLSMFILSGNTIKGTIIDRIVNFGLCPIKCAYDKNVRMHLNSQPDGIVESLKQLLYHDNYIKPWSDQHILTVLLTKAC